MKNRVLFAVATVLLAIWPATLAAVNTITYTATYDFSKLTVGSDTLGGVTYTTVRYDGLSNCGEPGTPWLPVDYIKFSVPWNATNFVVVAQPKNCDLLQITYPVYPSQQNSVPPTIVPPNSGVYYSGDFFPPQGACCIDEGFLAGENRIVTVAVTPVSCLHDGRVKQLRTAQQIGLTLSYDLTDSPYTYPLVRRDTTLRNKGFEMTRDIVANPGDVRANAFSGNPDMLKVYPIEPQEPNGPAETFLIVATPEASHPMRRLAALRQQKGMNVKVVTINEALTDTLAGQGDLLFFGGDSTLTYTDDAGKLRQYLRMHYLYKGTEYVLLSGTSIPSRIISSGEADMYFSDINDNWSVHVSDKGDLFVGRLLGGNSNQFDNYIDKLLRYELNPGNGDRSYLRRALATEGSYCATSGPSTYLYPAYPDYTFISPDIDEIEVTGSDVIDSIRTNHYGLISAFNNGFPSGMTIYEDNLNQISHYIWAIDTVKVAPDIIDNETGNGLNSMDNKYFPMIFLSFLGNNIPYHSVPGYNIALNYGESFTTGKDYGGPAFLGLTGNVSFSNASTYARVFLTDLLYQQPVLGKNCVVSKVRMYNLEDIICHYNYLGDPALRIWRDLPQSFSNISVSRTDNSVTISGLPSVSTTVAYHSNDGVTGTCVTSASSVCLSNVSPNSSIMIYRDDYIPYIAPLMLQNTTLDNSQYVIAEDVTIGHKIDSIRTSGDVTVSDGATYEIEAAGEVTIAGGFSVEQGASFAVYPSSFI